MSPSTNFPSDVLWAYLHIGLSLICIFSPAKVHHLVLCGVSFFCTLKVYSHSLWKTREMNLALLKTNQYCKYSSHPLVVCILKWKRQQVISETEREHNLQETV